LKDVEGLIVTIELKGIFSNGVSIFLLTL
jgi:hypothetical protein